MMETRLIIDVTSVDTEEELYEAEEDWQIAWCVADCPSPHRTS